MSTDFSYDGKQIVSGGPLKPNGKDMPSDARTRVDCYADIATIPNPYVGLKITVKVDETNNNKMTDYIVKSLKANSIGVANSLIDEVVRYVDYLGVSSSGGGTSSGTGTGLTSEQAQQLQTAYEHSQITHVQASDIPSLEGYATETFVTNNYASKNHNHSEYASSSHRHDASEIDNLPSGGVTAEQAAQIQTNTNDITNLKSKISDIPIKITKSEYNALPENEKTGKVFMIIDEPEEEYSLSYSNNTLKLLKGSKIISTVTITSSTQTPTETYGEIILSKESSTIIKGNKDTFTVCLDKAPTNEQIISLTSNSMDVTLSTETLTFTSDNYNVPQSVEITVASSTTLTNASISLTSSNVTSKSVVITISNSSSSSEGATLMHSYDLSSANEDSTYHDLTNSWNLNSSKQADRGETTLINRLGSFSIKMYDYVYSYQHDMSLFHTGQTGGVNVWSKTPVNGRILINKGISYGNATGSITLKYYDIDTGSLNENVATSGNIPLNSNPTIILTSDAENKVTKLYIDGVLAYTLNQQTALCGLVFDVKNSGKVEIYSGVLKVGE